MKALDCQREFGLQSEEVSGEHKIPRLVVLVHGERGKRRERSAREGGGKRRVEESAIGREGGDFGASKVNWGTVAAETFRPASDGQRPARFHHVSIYVHNARSLQQTLSFIGVADKATVTVHYPG